MSKHSEIYSGYRVATEWLSCGYRVATVWLSGNAMQMHCGCNRRAHNRIGGELTAAQRNDNTVIVNIHLMVYLPPSSKCPPSAVSKRWQRTFIFFKLELIKEGGNRIAVLRRRVKKALRDSRKLGAKRFS